MKLIPKAVERVFYGLTRRLVDGLIRAGIRPNVITTIGTLLVVVSAVAFGLGRVRLGGLLYLPGQEQTRPGKGDLSEVAACQHRGSFRSSGQRDTKPKGPGATETTPKPPGPRRGDVPCLTAISAR